MVWKEYSDCSLSYWQGAQNDLYATFIENKYNYVEGRWEKVLE
jgi:hypothetical protein